MYLSQNCVPPLLFVAPSEAKSLVLILCGPFFAFFFHSCIVVSLQAVLFDEEDGHEKGYATQGDHTVVDVTYSVR